MKKKLLTVAQVLEYVFTFIYSVVCALFFSMSNKLYILFLILIPVSLILGLYTETIKYHLENNELNKKHKIILIIITVVSLIACPACLFNLLALTNKKDTKVIKSVNLDYVEKEKEEKKWYKKTSFILCVTSLVLIIVLSVVGNLFETTMGSVIVKDATLTKKETDVYNVGHPLNGTTFAIEDSSVKVSYTMYKPKKASQTNLYPVVFVLPGFTRTKATMSQYAIELSRRGAVVFVIDPGSQGSTTYGGYDYDDSGKLVKDANGNKVQNSYSVARSGMGYLIQYVYNNIDDFDFIDRDRIGIAGHSAGGGDACKLAADFAGASYEESIIKALYISGYIKTSAANVFYQLHCNTALSYAKYDEGSFRYQDENQAYEVIALRFINEVESKNSGKNGHFDYFIEDYEYGDSTSGTYRIIHHEEINHCFEMYDPTSITNTTNFFRINLGLNTKIKDSSQVWFGQELANGLCLALAFTFIISLLFVAVDVIPFMKSVKEEADERKNNEQEIRQAYTLNVYERGVAVIEQKEKTFGKRALFWLPMILTAIIACLDYIPLARLSMDIFPEAAGNIYTYKFPARMMNAVFLWAVVNGAVGLVVWAGLTALENLYYTIKSKVTGEVNKADWSKFKGLKVKPLNLLKTLALAIVLFFVFYGLLALMYLLTHQDWRFMLISASPLSMRFVVTWLIYLAGFFVFYISNSIRVNLSIAREGYKEWQVMVIGALANSLGLVFMIIINYWVYFRTGTVYYGYYSATDASEMWLYINMVFGLIVMMAILPIFNRLVYKKIGNVYAGALLWCMIFIMMSLSASISFIPM